MEETNTTNQNQPVSSNPVPPPPPPPSGEPSHPTNYVGVAIVAVVIIAVISGGMWLWNNFGPIVKPVPETISPTPTGETGEFAGWQTYQSKAIGIEFKYPSKLSLTTENGAVILNHSIPYENHGKCDMMGDEQTYPTLDDFTLTFEISDKSLVNTVREISPYIPEENYVNNTLQISPGFIDEYENGVLKGYSIYEGVEGCGHVIYYFSTPDGRTLVIKHDMVQALSPVITEEAREKVLRVPGVITSEDSEKYFEQILSTFKFTASNSTTSSDIDKIFCGGISGTACPTGYDCKYDGDYPDAGGTCEISSVVNKPEACIQVITPARNLVTGEVHDFPTPCDVPEGWEKI